MDVNVCDICSGNVWLTGVLTQYATKYRIDSRCLGRNRSKNNLRTLDNWFQFHPKFNTIKQTPSPSKIRPRALSPNRFKHFTSFISVWWFRSTFEGAQKTNSLARWLECAQCIHYKFRFLPKSDGEPRTDPPFNFRDFHEHTSKVELGDALSYQHSPSLSLSFCPTSQVIIPHTWTSHLRKMSAAGLKFYLLAFHHPHTGKKTVALRIGSDFFVFALMQVL